MVSAVTRLALLFLIPTQGGVRERLSSLEGGSAAFPELSGVSNLESLELVEAVVVEMVEVVVVVVVVELWQ